MIILNRECSAPYVLLLAITGRRKIILLRIKDRISSLVFRNKYNRSFQGPKEWGGGEAGAGAGRGGNKAGEKIEQNKYVVFIIIYHGFVWSRYFAH